MKLRYLLLLLLLLPVISLASVEVVVSWDANTENVDGYKLYSAVGNVDKSSPVMSNTINTSVPFEFPRDLAGFNITEDDLGKDVCFRLTAYLGQYESGQSDQICGTIDEGFFSPGKPVGGRILINVK